MQAAILPFSAGWFWIRHGFELFRRQPLAMFFWSVVTSFLIMLSYAIPLLGQIVLIVMTPMLTFLTLCACRNIDKGIRMLPGMWLLPLREPGVKSRLIKLGSAYFVASMAAAIIATVPFLDTLMAAMDTQGQIDYAALTLAMRGPLVSFGILYVVISALFWHAPALIGWHEIRLTQALFFSMIACWRNKWAFLLYALSWAGVFFGLDAASGLLIQMGISATAIQWLLTPANIFIAAVLYCSFYPAYMTIFETPQPAADPAN
ncbi:hypothetical protein KVP09_01935 [Alcaligenaceae bacterium CGII-47]|nr:hypothetical protein [Alcaligenaceae bacterium CGII-47]